MAQKHTVSTRETLVSIARKHYDDPKLSSRLADFNGLRDPGLLILGQQLILPSRRELLGNPAPAGAVPGAPAPPNGSAAIKATFGDPLLYIKQGIFDRAAWEHDFIVTAALPFPLPLSWDLTQQATRFQCHKLMADVFHAVFAEIQARGLKNSLTSFAGCYEPRAQRASTKLSTHTWGIAMDLNAESNSQGTRGNIAPALIEIFRSLGFKWGGDWPGQRSDPMHFQYCTGY
jgi:hypothetical protein